MKRRINHESIPKESHSNYPFEFELGYIYRGIETELNALADKTGGASSATEFAVRLAQVLYAKASGSLVGLTSPMPALWRSPAKRSESVESVAVGRGAHRSKASVNRGTGAKSFWAKMTKEERSIEMKRRQKVAQRKRDTQAA